MEIIKLKIKDIVPYANNAKIHTPQQISQIKASIKEFGNNDPIAIDENNVIIAGHGRYAALQELGFDEIPVIRLSHLTDVQKKQYIFAHNKLTMNTGFDEELLKMDMEALEAAGADLEITGFSQKELEDLFNNSETEEELEDVLLEENERTKPLSYVQFCGKKVPLTEEEEEKLMRLFNEYTELYGTYFNFFNYLMEDK